MIPEQQQDVFALLGDPRTYGEDAAGRVERLDTHISAIFLAGSRVYKLKRAVHLPFVDFSGLEQRHRACLQELAVNRRTAPDIYTGVVPVTREADGRLTLNGPGEPVDWVVAMARFDAAGLFDRMAAEGSLTREHIFALADQVAAFHSAAEPRRAWGGESGIRYTIDTNAICFAQHMPRIFDAVQAGRVTEGSLAWLTRLAPLLEARRLAGLVRLCHGDLHLGNICLWRGRPTLFDGIEFCDDFACIDVFYDLAFLLMDLQARGLAEMSSWVMNRYLDRTDDLEGLATLPLFLSLRAAVRAHVAAAMAAINGDAARRLDAQDYLDRASTYLRPPPPRLLAVGGLSGSGKSRLARDIAPSVGPAPGAVVLRTDVIRKRLMGLAPEQRLGPEGYTAEVTERTYRVLLEGVERALRAGHAVIADAVFARPDQRETVRGVAARLGMPFDGLWLEANPELMRQRVEARRGNASDATAEVVEQQLTYDLGEMTWRRVDSSDSKADTLTRARAALGFGT